MKTLEWLVTAAAVLWAVAPLTEGGVYFVNELKNWTKARSFCRESNMDLVTLNGISDLRILSSLVDLNSMLSLSAQHRVWIGLYDSVTSWRWSLSNSYFYRNNEAAFRNWSPGEPNNQNHAEACVVMFDNGYWADTSCESSLKSACWNVSGEEVSFFRIDKGMTLTGAQSYCRQHYTDLASVRNASENEQIRRLVPKGQYIWIGLYRDSWKWVDGSNLLATDWKAGEPSHPQDDCVAAVLDANAKWEVWNCSSMMPFFCYVPASQKVLKLKLLKTSALDLTDPELQEDFLNKLKQKLVDDGLRQFFRLSWRTQSDGWIFHKDG